MCIYTYIEREIDIHMWIYYKFTLTPAFLPLRTASTSAVYQVPSASACRSMPLNKSNSNTNYRTNTLHIYIYIERQIDRQIEREREHTYVYIYIYIYICYMLLIVYMYMYIYNYTGLPRQRPTRNRALAFAGKMSSAFILS